ncbi:MAG: glycosyltransferase family 1 protein [Planctomycetota bacterium]
MKITVDFTAAIGDRTGIGTYTLELVRALLPIASPDEIRLVVHAFRHPGWHGKIRRLLGGGVDVTANRFLPHGLLLRTQHAFGRPRLETLFGASDVHHGTNFLAPPTRRAKVVITVHDLAFVKLADEIPVPHRYARWIGRCVGRADRIIAVSRATRDDVVELFDVAPDRVVIVPEGVPPAAEAVPEAEFAELRRSWGLPDRFFLFVGTLEPRKNLPLLVRALDRAAARLDEPFGLLLAGRPGWAMEELHEELARCRAPVATPGFLPPEVKTAALGAATALVMPSRWEGFGLPVLEAFAAGTPVIASDAGALPEVAGDAALLAPPEDEAAWADALVRVAEDDDLADRLSERGVGRAGEFTWERTARETLEVYRDA